MVSVSSTVRNPYPSNFAQTEFSRKFAWPVGAIFSCGPNMARTGDALSLCSRLNGACKKKPGSKPQEGGATRKRRRAHQRFCELERETT